MRTVVYSLSCHNVKLGSQVVRSQLGHRNPSRFVILFCVSNASFNGFMSKFLPTEIHESGPRHHLLRSPHPVPVKSMSLASGCSVITSQTVSRSPSQCTVCNRLNHCRHSSECRYLLLLFENSNADAAAPSSSAILLRYSEPQPRPRPRSVLPFVLLFTGLFLLLLLKVLGRMEGFKEGRSVSTPRASNQFCLTCCITFLLQNL
jgi:hypothetical protein